MLLLFFIKLEAAAKQSKKAESFLDLFRSGKKLRCAAIGMLYIKYVKMK